ncbi:hypothetical protein [Cytobacillus oceanisediminis]|uniref:hypothetical protein n=1 Tax=Cytobacillus oceanisediminis TaxID=665099 RepID=UPI00203B3B35|nr:hypothetical protein [Cytobacillus oceanisediminis]MCM3404926.1 hypothetical protein [Cytobacillus oceanisediminis]
MENYFYDSLATGFGNVIHTVHGLVGIAIFSNEEGTKVQPVAYDVPTAFVNQMSEEEKQQHTVFNKIYDISDVNFSEELTVFKKLHFIISDIEKTLY